MGQPNIQIEAFKQQNEMKILNNINGKFTTEATKKSSMSSMKKG